MSISFSGEMHAYRNVLQPRNTNHQIRRDRKISFSYCFDHSSVVYTIVKQEQLRELLLFS